MFCVAKEAVGIGRRLNRLDGNSHVPGGSVLEPDGTGKTGNQLPVKLAPGGACSNGSPTHKTGYILGDDHVQEFGPRRHAHFRQVKKEMASHPQTLINFE